MLTDEQHLLYAFQTWSAAMSLLGMLGWDMYDCFQAPRKTLLRRISERCSMALHASYHANAGHLDNSNGACLLTAEKSETAYTSHAHLELVPEHKGL